MRFQLDVVVMMTWDAAVVKRCAALWNLWITDDVDARLWETLWIVESAGGFVESVVEVVWMSVWSSTVDVESTMGVEETIESVVLVVDDGWGVEGMGAVVKVGEVGIGWIGWMCVRLCGRNMPSRRWAVYTSSSTKPNVHVNMMTNSRAFVQPNAASPASERMIGPIAVHHEIHTHASVTISQRKNVPQRWANVGRDVWKSVVVRVAVAEVSAVVFAMAEVGAAAVFADADVAVPLVADVVAAADAPDAARTSDASDASALEIGVVAEVRESLECSRAIVAIVQSTAEWRCDM